jgi:outer membrane protein assembly factor BamD (BamD/ComL family)
MCGMVKYVFLWLVIACTPLVGAYTVNGGKVMNVEEVATLSVQEHHSLLLEAMQGQNWQEMIRQATIIVKNFPETPFYQEAFYFMGVAYFGMGDFDISSEHLSTYLRKQTALQHFRDAIELKFQIAEKFRAGYKKHIGGMELLPKWMPAKEDALKIYEEVISALPNDDLAAKALYGKGILQMEDQEFLASVETYQTLIRRFPKHPLTPDAYVEIARVYLIQSQEKYPDSDCLDLASLNLRKFRQDFPMDPRVEEAEKLYGSMQEVFAESFYEIAQFYERAKKPHASVLYYSKIIKSFPNTKSAELSKKRLNVLRPSGDVLSNEQQPSISPVFEPELSQAPASNTP